MKVLLVVRTTQLTEKLYGSVDGPDEDEEGGERHSEDKELEVS